MNKSTLVDVTSYVITLACICALVMIVAFEIAQGNQRTNIANACTQIGGIPVQHYYYEVVCLDPSVVKKPIQ